MPITGYQGLGFTGTFSRMPMIDQLFKRVEVAIVGPTVPASDKGTS